MMNYNTFRTAIETVHRVLHDMHVVDTRDYIYLDELITICEIMIVDFDPHKYEALKNWLISHYEYTETELQEFYLLLTSSPRSDINN